MLFILVKGNIFAEVVYDPVHADADVSAASVIVEKFRILAFSAADDGGEDLYARSLLHFHDPVNDRIERLLFDLNAADGTVRDTDARVKQTQIVVYLRDRSDGRTRIFRGRFLIDRYGGRKPFYIIDVGLFHLSQKHSGVRGQRLDISSLPLGIYRIEGKA